MSPAEKLEASVMDAITTAIGEGMPYPAIACQVAAFVGSLTSFKPESEAAAVTAFVAATQSAAAVFNIGLQNHSMDCTPVGVTIQ